LKSADLFASTTDAVALAARHPQAPFAEHRHEFGELVLVWQGHGLHTVNDRRYLITAGDLFYLDATDRHRYDATHELQLHNIIYAPERLQLGVDWAQLLPPQPAPWRVNDVGLAAAQIIIEQMEQEAAAPTWQSALWQESLFLQLILCLQRHRYRVDSPDGVVSAPLDRLMMALSRSTETPFDLRACCEHYQLNERLLRQQFRATTGLSVSRYLNRRRLYHAQNLLSGTHLRISDIALQCGFEDSNYFSYVFHKEFGQSPRHWRQCEGQRHDKGA
jgi:AraC family L-rhamnose operon transcriptional activator RhaR